MKILIFCILIILATTACDSSSNKIVLNSNYKHDSSSDKPEERPSHNTI